MGSCQVLGRRDSEYLLMSRGFPLSLMKKHNILNAHNVTKLYTLKWYLFIMCKFSCDKHAKSP
jgi:hypothetical protein